MTEEKVVDENSYEFKQISLAIQEENYLMDKEWDDACNDMWDGYKYKNQP
jgi:hypothetical protein